MNKRRKVAAIAGTLVLVVVAATPASASSGSMNIYGCYFTWSNSSTYIYEWVDDDDDCTYHRVGGNGYIPNVPGVKGWTYSPWRDAYNYAVSEKVTSGASQSRHYVDSTLAISPYVV